MTSPFFLFRIMWFRWIHVQQLKKINKRDDLASNSIKVKNYSIVVRVVNGM